jgi:hypothetical protein
MSQKRPRRRESPLDDTAWRVLSDLLTPDGAFATLPPAGLQELIALRLAREAERTGLPLPDLAAAFERALADFSGAGRRPPAGPPPQADTTEPGA